MRRYPQLAVVIAVMALVLSACGSGQETAAPDAAEPQATQSPIDVEPAEDVDQEILDAAIEEGSVSYWSSIIQPGTNENLAQAFRERYGLGEDFAVNYTLLSTSDLATRAEEELAADALTVDVLSSGSVDFFYDLLDRGELMEYESPSHEAYASAFEAGLGEPGYWAADGFSLDTPIWNPQFLPDIEVESWQDILDHDLQGVIMMGDAEGSLTRRLSYHAMRTVLPREYFEALAEFNPGFAVRSEEVAQATVTGEYPFAFGGMPTRGYQVEQQAGGALELEVAYPTEGIVLLPQVFTILADAPNPNAAKLWIDFIFSEEGQQIYQAGEALISGREGFQTPSEKWSPPIDEIEVIPMQWDEITDEELAASEQEWLEIFRR